MCLQKVIAVATTIVSRLGGVVQVTICLNFEECAFSSSSLGCASSVFSLVFLTPVQCVRAADRTGCSWRSSGPRCPYLYYRFVLTALSANSCTLI